MQVFGHKFLIRKHKSSKSLPECDCVYLLISNRNGVRVIEYAGRTTNLKRRIASHNKIKLILKTLLEGQFIEIGFCISPYSYVIERKIIFRKKPKYNTYVSSLLIPIGYKKILEVSGSSELLNYK